eukprot:scaffold44352_cov62-Phaeocystis_antarctica.AAC.1
MVVHPSRPPLSSLTVIPDSSLFLTCRKSVESAPEKVHVSKVCRKCTRKGAQCHVSNELSGAGAECGKGNIK